ncbi:translation elongation factor Ts [Deltaproteobacteria bacterium TL4]
MANITANMVKDLREITGVAMMECKKALVESDGDMEVAKELLRKKGQAKALKKSARETSEGAVGVFISADRRVASIVKVACETDFVARNDKFVAMLQRLGAQVAKAGAENVLEQQLSEGGTIKDLLDNTIAELGENMQILDAQRVECSVGVIQGYVHTNRKIGVLVKLGTDKSENKETLEQLAKDIAMHIAASTVQAIGPEDMDQSVLQKEREIILAQAQESGKPANIIEKMAEGRIQRYLKEVCVLTQPFVKNPDQTIEQLVQSISKDLGQHVSLDQFVKFQF